LLKIIIDQERCKGCDICIEICPLKIFEKSKAPNEKGYYIPIPTQVKKCTAVLSDLLGRDVCGICERFCPEFAIKRGKNGKK